MKAGAPKILNTWRRREELLVKKQLGQVVDIRRLPRGTGWSRHRIVNDDASLWPDRTAIVPSLHNIIRPSPFAQSRSPCEIVGVGLE